MAGTAEELKRLKMLQATTQKKVDNLNPETLPLRVTDLEEKSHSHSNQSQLDQLTQGQIDILKKLGIDANGKLTLNGVLV